MVDSDPERAATTRDSSIRRLRLLSRLALAFLLDEIEIARDGRHIIDAVLLGVTVQANLGESRIGLDLAGGRAATVTDETLRPIPMNAMATSLGLPFETVRRRVRKLEKDGLCRVVKGGVIVPAAVLGRPHCEAMASRALMRLRDFYDEVAHLDLLPDLPRPSVQIDAEAQASAAAIRLTAEYVLREVGGLLESMGGLIDGLIAFDIFRANTAHFPHKLRGGEGYAEHDMVEDAWRRPVSTAGVAARLGIPPETVRRRVVHLLERGVCRRVSGGLIVPAEFWARPEVRDAVFANKANLHRLLAGLARLGLLELWERRRRAG